MTALNKLRKKILPDNFCDNLISLEMDLEI